MFFLPSQGGATDQSGWNKLSDSERADFVSSTSPGFRAALLMQLLGVADKADESDVLQKGEGGVEAGVAALSVSSSTTETEKSSLASFSQLPLAVVLPIAALRFWIKKSFELGDALSDAEVQAALSGSS